MGNRRIRSRLWLDGTKRLASRVDKDKIFRQSVRSNAHNPATCVFVFGTYLTPCVILNEASTARDPCYILEAQWKRFPVRTSSYAPATTPHYLLYQRATSSSKEQKISSNGR